jgi:hypothetical protein
MEPLFEVLKAWAEGVPFLAVGLVACLAVARLVRRASDREIPAAALRAGVAFVVALSLGVGLYLAWGRMALFDDAFISLRYARNLAEGHGLVWNPGERVEGYTNFLWTLLLALGIRATPLPGPLFAILLSLAVFVANTLAVASLGRALTRGYWLPLAAAATASGWVFSSYGTSGMESGLCALLVLAGLHRLMFAAGPRGYAVAGLLLILAALTRPDHGIFYAVGSGIVGWEGLRRLRAGERGEVLRDWLGWSAPFGLFVAYAVWKVGYYGHLLPNTYYAKSADLTWWSQGAIYAAMFWLGANAWLAAAGAGIFAAQAEGRAERRFAAFTVASVALYTLYTMKVGGDFMFGRFFVTLIPLVLLGTEALVFRSVHRPVRLVFALFALVAAAAPVTLFDGAKERWGIVDENQYWRVQALRPEVRIRAVHWKLGRFLRDEVKGRGIELVLGTGGIGMVGYYSGLPLIDSRGLTDATIARQPLAKRNRPGHEKVAPRDYLLARGVNLLRLKGGQRGFHPKRFRKLTRFSMRGAGIGDDWQIATWDRALMAQLAQVPGVDFVEFEPWLDRYIAHLDGKSASEVREDLPWLREYWFDHNPDPERLSLLEAKAGR